MVDNNGMTREVPFDKDAKCDVCGSRGAYDFMGDYFCAHCAQSRCTGVTTNRTSIWREGSERRMSDGKRFTG